MQRWEYLTIKIYGREWSDSLGREGRLPDSDLSAELLNELGQQGWELAGIVSGASSYADIYRLFLKRPQS